MTHDQAEAAFGAPQAPKPASRLGYWLAALLALAAVAGAVAWFVSGFSGFDDRVGDLHRVPVPGQQMITLESGEQAIYYESDDGEDATVPPLRIELLPVGGGPAVEIGEHGGKVTYSVGGHAGRSIAGFEIADAGSYVMSVEAGAENVPPEATLAVGEGIGGVIVRTVIVGLGILFGGLLAAGALTVVTVARRRQGKR